jgi:hypothetical protein
MLSYIPKPQNFTKIPNSFNGRNYNKELFCERVFFDFIANHYHTQIEH